MQNFPHYTGDYSQYLQDLRKAIFGIQLKAGKHLQLAHTTIGRYESGATHPPLDYLIYLVKVLATRPIAGAPDSLDRQEIVRDTNLIIKDYYPDADLFDDWAALQTYPAQFDQYGRPDHYVHRDWPAWLGDTAFQGRQVELARLKQLTRQAHCSLVAILGLGGMGKSVLAERYGNAVRCHYAHMLWCSLRDPKPLAQLLYMLAFLFDGTGAWRTAHYRRTNRCAAGLFPASALFAGAGQLRKLISA